MTAVPLKPVSKRRRRTDHFMRGLIWAGAIVALIPLVLVIYYILKKGLGVVSGALFTTDPTGATSAPTAPSSAASRARSSARWR